MPKDRPALGLEPLNAEQRKTEELKVASASAFSPEYSWAAASDMPVWRWSQEFDALLESREMLREKYDSAGYSLDPWDIYRVIPGERKLSSVYDWYQGSIPSCSTHGAAHAFQASTLYAIALGAPLVYDAVNPIYPFYRGRGGNYAGGLDLMTVAAEVNETGFFPVSAVGEDNKRVTREGLAKTAEASKYQAGILRIENGITEKIFNVCRGLMTVWFGATGYYSRTYKDENGVYVGSGFSYGGHAQAFTAYRSVNGKEYVWCQNSHGPIYDNNGNDPKSGYWCSMAQVETLAESMSVYGMPIVLFPEAPFNAPDLIGIDLPKKGGR